VRSIDLVARPRGDSDAQTLVLLGALARQTATDYGLEVRVNDRGEHPIIHFALSAQI
jgi:hypothetical protein